MEKQRKNSESRRLTQNQNQKCNSNSTKVQQHESATARKCNSTKVQQQQHKSATATAQKCLQQHKSATAQKCNSTKVQQHKSACNSRLERIRGTSERIRQQMSSSVSNGIQYCSKKQRISTIMTVDFN
jgi:hypothetical protein